MSKEQQPIALSSVEVEGKKPMLSQIGIIGKEVYNLFRLILTLQ
jgi:hypothetical protein